MQRKKLRRRKRPQLSVWGASVQDIADARGSTSGQTCRDAREASGLAGRGFDPLWPYSACTIPILRNSHERASCFYTISNKEIPPLYGEEQREIQKRKDEEK